jgi:hypothetical protein
MLRRVLNSNKHNVTRGSRRRTTDFSPERKACRALSHRGVGASRRGSRRRSVLRPTTSRQASAQINKLKQTRPSTRAERQIEQTDDRPVREAIQDS